MGLIILFAAITGQAIDDFIKLGSANIRMISLWNSAEMFEVPIVCIVIERGQTNS